MWAGRRMLGAWQPERRHVLYQFQGIHRRGFSFPLRTPRRLRLLPPVAPRRVSVLYAVHREEVWGIAAGGQFHTHTYEL